MRISSLRIFDRNLLLGTLYRTFSFLFYFIVQMDDNYRNRNWYRLIERYP